MIDPSRRPALHEAIALLYFGYRAFTDGPDRILERRGLGRVHHRILYFVGREPGLSVKRLLEILAVSKQALNAPLRQLLEMNLIAASTHSADRRIKVLTLTGAGARLETDLTDTQMTLIAAAFDAAGEAKSESWRDVMNRLASPNP